MPTLVAMPWPSGPVVDSTPVVQPYSGCPGQRLPSSRNDYVGQSDRGAACLLIGGLGRLDPGQMDQAVKQHRGVPRRQHEAVTVDPMGSLWIVAQELLPQRIGRGCCVHGRAGMA